MLLNTNIEGAGKFKRKPRGKPFPKGNFKGKIMDTERHTTSNKGTDIKNAPAIEEKIEEIKTPSTQVFCVPAENEKEEFEKQEVVEELNFFSENGKNKISIRFSKKHNRMFRLQIFLNDEVEIRPVTYTGANTGYSYWNMLKGSLKK